MMKYSIILLFLIAFPLHAQEEDFNFQIESSDTVVAGKSFEVTLIIKKGSLKDYSRFSQDLPSGVTAENIQSPNADFTFSDQRVRIIWLKLPAEQEIEVKYAIKTDERIKGKLELGGIFAFVKQGEREYLEIEQPRQITILPNPDIDQSLVVDINDYNSIKKPVNIVPIPEKAVEKTFATVVRQKPIIEQNGIVYINLLVHTPEGTSYLKLEESIPGGYSFESINNGGGVVSESAGQVRYIWMKAPLASDFLIQYRLLPILENTQGAMIADGKLSYTENGVTKTISIPEVDLNISAMTPAQQSEYLKNGTIPADLAQKKIFITDRPVKVVPAKQQRIIDKPVAKTATKSNSKTRSDKSTIIDIENLEKEDGVYYRVQVAAVKYPYFPEVVFAEYDVLRDVKVEVIDIWSKYTLGSVPGYEDAKILKAKIKAESPVQNPFIVAYRNGSRVPIKDVY